jgi:hypothetical protein
MFPAPGLTRFKQIAVNVGRTGPYTHAVSNRFFRLDHSLATLHNAETGAQGPETL